MSWKHLGPVFDIHGGGIDLVFPHHENEIAQSRCALSTPAMANYWLHNGFLMVEGEKMSKSLGNFVTIRDVLADWPGDVVRLNMLKTHYRQPIDWTAKGLEESARVLERWQRDVGDAAPDDAPDTAFLELLSDDMNTPAAITRLHELSSVDASHVLKSSAMLLGLLGETASEREAREIAAAGVDEAAVDALVDARAAAKKVRNFAEADRLRDELAAMGIMLKDAKDPTTGEPVTTWEVAR